MNWKIFSFLSSYYLFIILLKVIVKFDFFKFLLWFFIHLWFFTIMYSLKIGFHRKCAFFARLAVLFRLHASDGEAKTIVDYRYVYPILYRSLAGYGIPEDLKEISGDLSVLGPVHIQRKAFHEVFMSAMRAEYHDAAIRHLCCILQVSKLFLPIFLIYIFIFFIDIWKRSHHIHLRFIMIIWISNRLLDYWMNYFDWSLYVMVFITLINIFLYHNVESLYLQYKWLGFPGYSWFLVILLKRSYILCCSLFHWKAFF